MNYAILKYIINLYENHISPKPFEIYLSNAVQCNKHAKGKILTENIQRMYLSINC